MWALCWYIAGIMQSVTFVGVAACTVVSLLRDPLKNPEFEEQASMRSLSWPSDRAA
jgi:hypothetical protein